MEKAVLTGGSTSQMIGAAIVNEGGSVAKPMPGRYQVGNELGQGAIGVV